jgi:serine/threonine protein kinase
MEYLEGEGLDAAMSNLRPHSLIEKLAVVIHVCHGLSYAHARGVIHRDIKPANIMLIREGGVKIFDFGIAYAGKANLTRTGKVMGTLRYMAPEQFNSKSADSLYQSARCPFPNFSFLSLEKLTPNARRFFESILTTVGAVKTEKHPEGCFWRSF